MSQSTSDSMISAKDVTGVLGYGRGVAWTVSLVLLVNLVVRGVSSEVVPEMASFEQLGWGPVVVTSIMVGLGAVAAYSVLERVTPSHDRIFLVLATAVLAVSLVPVFVFVPPFPGVTPDLQAVMVVMHVVSAVVAVVAVRRTR